MADKHRTHKIKIKNKNKCRTERPGKQEKAKLNKYCNTKNEPEDLASLHGPQNKLSDNPGFLLLLAVD
jgi:hypothetical protein